MKNFNLKEIVAIHKAVSELNIKGADAPFITTILTKLTEEYNKLQKVSNEPIKK